MSRPININDLRPFANPTALAAIDRAEARRRAAFQFDGNLGDGISAAAGAVLGGASAGAGGSLGSGGQTGVGGSAGGDHVLGREVVLQIKGDPADGFFYSETEWIKNVLEARGWAINGVDQISSTLLGDKTFRVTAAVGNQYSDSQIITNARNHLIAKGMTISAVDIVQASPASYVQGVNAGSGGDGSNAGASINSMIAGAALGLGVSSTVLLIGGAAVLLLVLRRR